MAFGLVRFKKGTLSDLNTLAAGSGVEEGTFYLTIDNNRNTSRLYIGTGVQSILPVNSNITVVSTTDDLTDAHAATFYDGDFAYVTTGNILAVRYNGHWTQINAPDSRAVKDLTPSIATSNGVATITWTLRDQNNNVIKTSDATPVTPAITMQGANGVTVSGSGKDVTVTGTSYRLGNSAVSEDPSTNFSISLLKKENASASETVAGEVFIYAGNNISLTGLRDDDITISATDTTLSSVTTAPLTPSGFLITVTDSSSNSDSATINPKITLGANTTEYVFANGTANLPVYTKTEIDNQNKALNAMVYRGTVGTGGSKATSIDGISTAEPLGMKIGYTYKLIGDGSTSYTVPISSSATATAHGGDLIIANGIEGSDNNITSASLYYDIVPSGDDVNDYTLEPTTHGVSLEEGGVAKGSFTLAEGTAISLADNTTGDDRTVTINHGSVVRTDGTGTAIAQTAGSDKQFTVVTGVASNTQGHVTGITTTSVTVKDSVAAMSSVANAVSYSGNEAIITTTVGLTPYTGATASTAQGSFKITSESLILDQPTTQTGTVPEIKMELAWGTISNMY